MAIVALPATAAVADPTSADEGDPTVTADALPTAQIDGVVWSQVVVGKTYHPFETFTVVLIVYFVLSWPVARGVDHIYRRVAHLGAS